MRLRDPPQIGPAIEDSKGWKDGGQVIRQSNYDYRLALTRPGGHENRPPTPQAGERKRPDPHHTDAPSLFSSPASSKRSMNQLSTHLFFKHRCSSAVVDHFDAKNGEVVSQ